MSKARLIPRATFGYNQKEYVAVHGVNFQMKKPRILIFDYSRPHHAVSLQPRPAKRPSSAIKVLIVFNQLIGQFRAGTYQGQQCIPYQVRAGRAAGKEVVNLDQLVAGINAV